MVAVRLDRLRVLVGREHHPEASGLEPQAQTAGPAEPIRRQVRARVPKPSRIAHELVLIGARVWVVAQPDERPSDELDTVVPLSCRFPVRHPTSCHSAIAAYRPPLTYRGNSGCVSPRWPPGCTVRASIDNLVVWPRLLRDSENSVTGLSEQNFRTI